ncbi:MAG: GLPGLI family protein [Flavobacteriaceae bacterium]|nr:GLPGLI family protein [Flavobacteriaceae bacterium]
MKTKLFAIVFALATLVTYSQDFSGKAIYKTSRKSNFKINDSKMTDKQKAQFEARVRKMNQKTYILNFDKNTSTYEEDVKLDAPKKPNVGGSTLMVMSFGGSGDQSIYYKNIKENRFVNQTDIMSKPFLVKDKLKEYSWEMSTETKNIGNYTCYKATHTEEVENTKVSIVNGETKEVTEKKMVTTTAWYTPQIPVSNGPNNYHGLPGLILEINDGTTTTVCTEIILNSDEKIKIDEPTKGKEVTQAEFDEISEKKSKEMMERFKSRNGVDMGNGIRIKMN